MTGGSAITYTYDDAGRRTRTTGPLSGFVYTDYVYDNLGRLISVTDPSDLETVYSYDAVGNLIESKQIDTWAMTGEGITNAYSVSVHHNQSSCGLAML